MRQRFGELPAAHDGLVAVAVRTGDVLSVSSSLSPDVAAPEPATLKAAEAVTLALRDAGLTQKQLADHRVRLVAMPMPGATARAAYEVVLVAADAEHGYTTYVDARNGKVLVRENLVELRRGQPALEGLPGHSDAPARTPGRPGVPRLPPECTRVVLDPATGKAWDIDPATGATSQTTRRQLGGDRAVLGRHHAAAAGDA